ncbi:MAG: GIY-YIG nuclease family protein [Pseudomonadales bacterium]|nr:GIY-YIG nuclease family protein [Pseudomonadales bacterium]
MDKLEFIGPYKFEGSDSIFDGIDEVISGVYLWCVKTNDESFKVYYVGEAADIKKRMREHYKNQLSGKYTGHCLDSLKNNAVILVTTQLTLKFVHNSVKK